MLYINTDIEKLSSLNIPFRWVLWFSAVWEEVIPWSLGFPVIRFFHSDSFSQLPIFWLCGCDLELGLFFIKWCKKLEYPRWISSCLCLYFPLLNLIRRIHDRGNAQNLSFLVASWYLLWEVDNERVASIF